MTTLRQAILNRDPDAAARAVISIFGQPPKQYDAATAWHRQYDTLVMLIAKHDWDRLEHMLDGVVDERAYFVKRRYHKRRCNRARNQRVAPTHLFGVIDDETGEIVRSSHYSDEADDRISRVLVSGISQNAKKLFRIMLNLMPIAEQIWLADDTAKALAILRYEKSNAALARTMGVHVNTILNLKKEIRRVFAS